MSTTAATITGTGPATYTAEELRLALALYAVGVEGRRTKLAEQRRFLHAPAPEFVDLETSQQAGWCAVARHLIGVRDAERVLLTSVAARIRTAQEAIYGATQPAYSKAWAELAIAAGDVARILGGNGGRS